MRLNPYIEIVARQIYNKSTKPIPFPSEDKDLALDAIKFMNTRSYAYRFSLSIMGDKIDIQEAK